MQVYCVWFGSVQATLICTYWFGPGTVVAGLYNHYCWQQLSGNANCQTFKYRHHSCTTSKDCMNWNSKPDGVISAHSLSSTQNISYSAIVFWYYVYNTIQYNNTESMLPPTYDQWPRTMLLCAKGMLTKIKKDLSLCLKTRVSVTVLRSVGSWLDVWTVLYFPYAVTLQ